MASNWNVVLPRRSDIAENFSDQGDDDVAARVESILARHDESQIQSYVCRLSLGLFFRSVTQPTEGVSLGGPGWRDMRQRRSWFVSLVRRSPFLHGTTLRDLESWGRLASYAQSLNISPDQLNRFITQVRGGADADERFSRLTEAPARLLDLLLGSSETLLELGMKKAFYALSTPNLFWFHFRACAVECTQILSLYEAHQSCRCEIFFVLILNLLPKRRRIRVGHFD